MVQIRVTRFCRRGFERDVYRPGVVSMTRIVWGSLGAGLLLFVVAGLSQGLHVAVLLPPLAASCFIGGNTIYLRVARPKQVIVGHFVSAVGGVLGVWVGEAIAGGGNLAAATKLGVAVLFAAALMQACDADHPPAAATAAIPAILPMPVAWWLLPAHMAWGAVLVVVGSALWNRIWTECPAPEPETPRAWLGLNMEKSDIAGTAVCCLGFLLMCFSRLSEPVYLAGVVVITAGTVFLAFDHLPRAQWIRTQTSLENGGKGGR